MELEEAKELNYQMKLIRDKISRVVEMLKENRPVEAYMEAGKADLVAYTVMTNLSQRYPHEF